jgi:hypothetical protein
MRRGEKEKQKELLDRNFLLRLPQLPMEGSRGWAAAEGAAVPRLLGAWSGWPGAVRPRWRDAGIQR